MGVSLGVCRHVMREAAAEREHPERAHRTGTEAQRERQAQLRQREHTAAVHSQRGVPDRPGSDGALRRHRREQRAQHALHHQQHQPHNSLHVANLHTQAAVPARW